MFRFFSTFQSSVSRMLFAAAYFLAYSAITEEKINPDIIDTEHSSVLFYVPLITSSAFASSAGRSPAFPHAPPFKEQLSSASSLKTLTSKSRTTCVCVEQSLRPFTAPELHHTPSPNSVTCKTISKRSSQSVSLNIT